ncbi:hypothetical protein BDV18DRAFT_26830 [Aspergillus unguis]
MAGEQPTNATPAKRQSRSRKGCPECRRRRIKCDEKKPECGQCLKSGRHCEILDSLFKPHSLTFAVNEQPAESRCNGRPSQKIEAGVSRAVEGSTVGQIVSASEQGKDTPGPLTPQNRLDHGQSMVEFHPRTRQAPIENSPARTEWKPEDICGSYGDETYEDRCEIAFFLRHFCEGPGQWMDICGGQSYFSENMVTLAHWSPLIRYAACALGAKQLGQTRNPSLQIRQTRTQSLMMKALVDTKLGFTWYGAKYYEKAIKLLAEQLANSEPSSQLLSPSCIYGSGVTPSQASRRGKNEELPFQILAACIMCQYEDVNATINAWTGHLNGVFRLLRPLPGAVASFEACSEIPQPRRAHDAVVWFAVVNDMLNSFVTKQRTRIDPDNLVLWRDMGLPVDGLGNLIFPPPTNAQLHTILFKALVRLMCQLVNANLANRTQWTTVNEQFDLWQASVPEAFYIPITWPPLDANAAVNDPFEREMWFASDTSAITLAFYHMARTILLNNRPVDLPEPGGKELNTSETLNQDLRKHAMEIIPIMNAMPSETLQKHMLQPLYVAGRCLTDDKERKALLRILQNMADDFGLFTDYRIQDLCEEWGVPCSGIDRTDGHGILT